MFCGWVDSQTGNYQISNLTFDYWHGDRQMLCEEWYASGFNVTLRGWSWINVYVNFSAYPSEYSFGATYVYATPGLSNGAHDVPVGKYANHAPMYYLETYYPTDEDDDRKWCLIRIPASDYYDKWNTWTVWGAEIWKSRSSNFKPWSDTAWITASWFYFSKS